MTIVYIGVIIIAVAVFGYIAYTKGKVHKASPAPSDSTSTAE